MSGGKSQGPFFTSSAQGESSRQLSAANCDTNYVEILPLVAHLNSIVCKCQFN